MAECSVVVVQLIIEPHTNADSLEVALVGDFRCAVQKGLWQTGDIGIYCEEGNVIPGELLRAAGYWDYEKDKGILAGGGGDRVKAIKLRGQISQGIILDPRKPGVWPHKTLPPVGREVGPELGITKYEVPVPTELAGEVYQAIGLPKFDVENIKKHRNLLERYEGYVQVTEKLHGSCLIAVLDVESGEQIIASKGLASRGLALDDVLREDGSSKNAYWRAAKGCNLFEKMAGIGADHGAGTVTVIGELLGVQDLMYGESKGSVSFRAFDLLINGAYVTARHAFVEFRFWGIPIVPVLYEGPYSAEKIAELTDGPSIIAEHIREGVVIRTLDEIVHTGQIGRLILKSVSEKYLLRKNATEYS